MKFLTDENLGRKVPQYLREAGYDVISCLQGSSDIEVLQLANKEERVLITLDKDFGELVFKEKLIHKGVIFLRLRKESIENKKKVLLKVLSSKMKFDGKFTVVRR